MRRSMQIGWRRDRDNYIRHAGMDGVEDPELAEQLARKYATAPGYSLVSRVLLDDGKWSDWGPYAEDEVEPVGPYAPTREGTWTNGTWTAGESLLRDVAGLGKRLDGLVDAIMRLDERGTTRHQEILTSRYDDGFKDGQVEGQRSAAKLECSVDHEHAEQVARQRGFEHGRMSGKAERESELIDAGWTPPGAVVGDAIEWSRKVAQADMEGYRRGASMIHECAGVHELEVGTGPTDYQVWRDALTLAVHRVPNDAQADQIQATAEAFWEQLQDVPVLKNDDGTDTTPVEPCPECRSGKHGNCTESVLDAADEMVPCPCPDAWHDTATA